ncbi:MAG: substrate-binding domain-containing protein [Cyanobacteria bacterium P01_F01_bin.116]
MQNIPKILLRTYLRRRPVHIRFARFNFLARYSWLKNLLEDLKPELFPEKPEEQPASALEDVETASEDVLKLLDEKLKGKRGIYEVQRWLGKRGHGHLFLGQQIGSQQPVFIKEYLLPHNIYSHEEARQRQQAFVNLAGLDRPDERSQDIRILRPLEAIADTNSAERCYLVTEQWDGNLTLHGKVLSDGALNADQVRKLLIQILQTLSVLHQQKVTFPSGQTQAGLVHGNLSLKSLLWVEEKAEQPFIYLSDFGLWENLFELPPQPLQSSEVSEEQVILELQALGQVGYCLLTGTTKAEIDEWPQADLFLNSFIKRLLRQEGAPFLSAEEAWRTLIDLPTVQPHLQTATDVTELIDGKQQRQIPRALLMGTGASVLALMGGLAWFLIPRDTDSAVAQAAPTCCLQEVGAVPAGTFTYTAIEGGLEQALLGRQNLGQVGQSLRSALRDAQPDLSLTYLPARSTEDAIAHIQSGQADFAILPLALTSELPLDIADEVIAYDGLAAFVAFSYAERAKGLPKALDGQLSLENLQAIYLGNIDSWRDVGGPWLPVQPYRLNRPEIAAVFEQQVLSPLDFSSEALINIPELPTLEMLRTIIRDFETDGLGSVGFAPLSQILGQCSVYPLALQADGKKAVQPWVLRSGDAIEPTTDLCDRKGLYHPNIEAFQTGTYPLTYTLSVVYPQDNSRQPVGQKFAELLQTDEGQHLLNEAGLVPLRPLWQQRGQQKGGG